MAGLAAVAAAVETGWSSCRVNTATPKSIGKAATVGDRVELYALTDRAQVGLTLHHLGLRPRFVQCRQKDADEQGDNADHDKQFHQCEPCAGIGTLLQRVKISHHGILPLEGKLR